MDPAAVVLLLDRGWGGCGAAAPTGAGEAAGGAAPDRGRGVFGRRGAGEDAGDRRRGPGPERRRGGVGPGTGRSVVFECGIALGLNELVGIYIIYDIKSTTKAPFVPPIYVSDRIATAV